MLLVAHTSRLICRRACIAQGSRQYFCTDSYIFRSPRVTKPLIHKGPRPILVQPCHRFSWYHLPYQVYPQSRPSSPWLFDGTQQVPTPINARHFSTMAWVLLKPVAKVVVLVFGRGINRWYAKLDAGRRQEVWHSLWQHRYAFYGTWSAMVFSGLVYYLTHLQIAPITERMRFISFSEDQTREMANFQTNLLLSIFRNKMHNDDNAGVRRVKSVTQKLVDKNAEIRAIPIEKWNIHIIKDPIVNAFVLPSGHIFVFEGLLELLNTDDQLAIILGHEMAHAVLNHGVETMSLSDFEDFVIVVGFFYIWCVISSIIQAIAFSWLFFTVVDLVTFMPHSRRVEWEADFVGLIFAANACYDIRQAGFLWRKIARYQNESHAGFSFLPEWMLTHPDSSKRADYFDSLKVEAEKWRAEKGCPQLPPEITR